MTTNRLYAVFAVVITLGLAVAALLASPLVPGAAALFGQGASAPDARAAQQARDEFRSGERLAGSESLAAAGLARFDQRRGGWFAGQPASPAERHMDRARDDWYATK